MSLRKNFRNLNLNTKLLIILITSLVLFALMITTVRVFVFRQASVQAGNQRALQEIELVKNQIEAVENDLLLSSKLLSNSPGLARAITNEDRNTLLARTLTGISSLDLDIVDVIDVNREILVSNDRIESHFAPETKQEMFTLGLLGVESSGMIVHKEDEHADLNMMLTAVTAVRDDEGSIVGAVLVGRELNSDQLASININRDDVHLLLIHDGQIIDQDSVSIAMAEEHHHHAEAAAGSLAIDDTEIDTAMLEQAINGRFTVIPGNNPDFPQVITLTPFPVSSDVPLLLAIQIGQLDLAAFSSVLARNSIFLISGLIATFFIIISVFTRANITQPIKNLSLAASQIAEGNYDQRIDIRSKDEIGQLGLAFNTMATAVQSRDGNLNELNATLEQRVQERTAELEQTNVKLLEEVFERQKAEKMLRQQRRFLRQVLDINPSYIFAKDRDGRFTLVNKAIAEAYGTIPQEMIGKTDADFNPDSDRVEDFRRDDLAVMDSLQDKFIPEEPTTIAATGTLRWLQTLKRPIVDEDGRADQVLVVVTDITERKQIEDELAAARDEAVKASQLKTQLLANVSHDLRTPLNAILGYLELLQLGIYGPISDDQQNVTIQMMESTRQLLEFVNNLLSQAQIESGEMKLHISPFTPANIVNRVQLALEVLAFSKNVTLASKIEPDVPDIILGSEAWLNQILLNLVSNAIKFTDEGSVNIHIFQPDSLNWAISVSDTGIGIPAEAQATIFDAFQQVDGSITRGRGGSGLGLSIVKKLTTLMGGTIQLTSELNGGSEFTLILPLTVPEEKVNDKSVSINR